MAPAAPILILAAMLALAGCGGDGEPAATSTGADGAAASAARASLPRSRLDPPRCDATTPACAEATGEVAYVERIDPDGDGDAHFVLLSADGITAPGVSVIDVAAALRPRPLPRRGDLLAAAGPVYHGSYGQRQIQATAIDVVRIRRNGG